MIAALTLLTYTFHSSPLTPKKASIWKFKWI